ncbi:hypothetical protein [Ammoniphilus sp. YIM 78166]|uniref:hypothetical protein n=1 Tax=Ammoniphilus sp. YIM 78166 TaxID=1644106 RepID=UPI00106F24C2|nr:hypothetical protein [Ammoniphilus sp. YIM 78166]
MPLFHSFLLLVAWTLVLVSEKAFPKANRMVALETEFLTLFLFKPFHLFLSFFCFLLAFLIFRGITLLHLRNLFLKGNRTGLLTSLFVLVLGWGMLAIVITKHPVPTAILLGTMLLYDSLQWMSLVRRNKRLKSAFEKNPTRHDW